MRLVLVYAVVAATIIPVATALHASDVGKHFPSEKKSYVDEVTGLEVTVLTSSPANDVRIYQTHPQWTADGKWVVFRTKDRSADGTQQAFAVNEASGDIVQLTDGPGLNPKSLTLSEKQNVLYYMRQVRSGDPEATEIVELKLDPILADSNAGAMKEGAYERVVATLTDQLGGMIETVRGYGYRLSAVSASPPQS
jgi:oligogalacturonide lyase